MHLALVLASTLVFAASPGKKAGKKAVAPHPAAPAEAAETIRVAVAPFSGPGGAIAQQQVASALCRQLTCVPEKKVLTKAKVDFKKAQKEKVKYVVTGAIAKSLIGDALDLSVMQGANKKVFSSSYPVEGGQLSPGTVETARKGILRKLGLPVPEDRAIETP